MKITCELGERKFVQEVTGEQAIEFVHAVVKNEDLRWNSPSEATAKGGVLVIRAAGLEDLVDAKPKGTLAPEIAGKVKSFLNGKWENEKTATPKKPAEKKKDTALSGLVSLADLCTRNKGWKPRAVRIKLRAAKIKKPASGSWAWPSNEAKKIETKLKELMK